MRRTNWKTVSTLVTMVVMAGCQDRTVTAPAGANSHSAMLAPAGSPRLSSGDLGDLSLNTSGDFVVPPQGGTFYVGGTAIVFPAGSICDPAVSSYGEGTWDDKCTSFSKPIAIHAEVRTAKLGTWIDFTPALRFVPSDNPNRWVWLFMYNPAAVDGADLSKLGINYASKIGDLGVDEALSDSTMRTYFNGSLLLRRIKHFSGYVNGSGRSCDPAVEPDCYPDTSGGGVGGGTPP